MSFNRIVVILSLIIFIVSCIFALNYKIVAWDASQYLRIADFFYTGNKEMLVPLWLPLLSFIEYGLFLIFGENLTFVNIFYSLFPALLIFFIFKLFELEFDSKTGLFAALLTALNSTILYWGSRLYLDLPATVLLIVGFYYFIKAIKIDKKKYYLISGIFLGLATFMKFLFLFFVFPVAVYIFLRKLYSKKILYLIFAFIIAILPWFIINFYLFSDALYAAKYTFQTYLFSQKESFFDGLIKFAAAANILLLFASFAILKRALNFITLSSIIFLLIFLFLPSGKDIRYAIPSLVLVSGLAGVGISQIKNKIIILFSILLIAIINIPILISSEMRDWECSENSPIKAAGEYLKEKGGIISADNFWPQISWYSKKNVFYLSEEMSERSDYIVLEGGDNARVDMGCVLEKEFNNICLSLKLFYCH